MGKKVVLEGRALTFGYLTDDDEYTEINEEGLASIVRGLDEHILTDEECEELGVGWGISYGMVRITVEQIGEET